jgi:hypothetical protein
VVTAGHVHTVPVCAKVENVVFAGIASVNFTFAAAAGPLFFTTIE